MEPNQKLYKIAVLGAESTGKTTLCRQLAEHFHTRWVPEYAREYIEQITRDYVLKDLEIIAERHVQNEIETCRIANKYIFVDTEMIILKVWAKEKFQSIPEFISRHLLKQQYDLYLVMANDLPWVYDPVRENPDKRDYLLNLYMQELDEIKARQVFISGFGEERFLKAVAEVGKLGGGEI